MHSVFFISVIFAKQEYLNRLKQIRLQNFNERRAIIGKMNQEVRSEVNQMREYASLGGGGISIHMMTMTVSNIHIIHIMIRV